MPATLTPIFKYDCKKSNLKINQINETQTNSELGRGSSNKLFNDRLIKCNLLKENTNNVNKVKIHDENSSFSSHVHGFNLQPKLEKKPNEHVDSRAFSKEKLTSNVISHNIFNHISSTNNIYYPNQDESNLEEGINNIRG